MDAYVLAALTIGVFVHIFFVIAQFRKDNSVMTFAWPLGLLSVEVILFVQFGSETTTQLVFLVLVVIWALRLFSHTFLRNVNRGYEDFRYAQLRDQTQSGFLVRSYLQFFVVQSIFMYLIALPIVIINTSNSRFGVVTYIGILVFVVGLLIETIADWQLSKFKATHSRDEVLTSGLWSLSRHPNYLGEALVWWGLFILTLPTGAWWVIVSPLLLTLSLRYVSGVPLIEERYEDNQSYREYMRDTNALIPFI